MMASFCAKQTNCFLTKNSGSLSRQPRLLQVQRLNRWSSSPRLLSSASLGSRRRACHPILSKFTTERMASARTGQPLLSCPQDPRQASKGSLRPVCFRDGQVAIRDGPLILNDVTTYASQHHAQDVLVLSMAAKAGPASCEDFPLGKLNCQRWLCCARNKLFWMTPEWGTTVQELPPETQFLLLELGSGMYGIILPLIDKQTYRGTLRPPMKGTPEYIEDKLVLRMESGCNTVLSDHWKDALLIAAGTDPFELIEQAVTAAAQRSGGAKPVREKQLPPNLDVFGWCSWDAFFTAVSASGLSQAVTSLAAGGTPPRWVVIDDGWQCTDLDERFRQPPAMMPPIHPPRQIPERDTKCPSLGDGNADTMESYMEGEMEILSRAARDIPAGTATGSIMQEMIATQTQDYADYHQLAAQRAAHPAQQRKKKRLLARVTSGILEYFSGLLMGLFQSLVLVTYQWVVDPAAPGSWTVRAFTYLTNGPIKEQMLQFYAVSTSFTRRLTDVKANSKFSSPDATADDISSGRPEKLGWVVKNLKKKFGVKYVYCWHGLPAYWAGVAADAPGVKKYGAKLCYGVGTPGLHEIEPSTGWNPARLGGIGVVNNARLLFNDMHRYLQRSGVSGVKVDCQAGVGLVGSGNGGGPAAALRFHTALEDSIQEHFPDNQAINCMCHSTENIYRWRDTAVSRVSDDFYPTDKGSYRPHITACAYNSLFISPLALPDWDMFHSKHAAGELHATARAVSGGPVYVSDAPGRHDPDLLRRMVLPDGTILRARLPGRPTRDSLFVDVARDGKSLLKVWNVNSCNGIVGVMNVQGASWDRSRRRFYIHNSSPPALTTTVRVTDVEPFRAYLAAQGCQVSAPQQSPAELATGAGASSAAAAANTAGEAFRLQNGVQGKGSEEGQGADHVGHSGMNGGKGGQAVRQQGQAASDFVVYVSATGLLHRVAWDEGVPVTLQGGESAMVTMAPILSSSATGLEFSPVGFSNMMNGGGGVLAVKAVGAALRLPSRQAALATRERAADPAAEPGTGSFETGTGTDLEDGGLLSDAMGTAGLMLAGAESAESSAKLEAVLGGGEARGADVAVHLRGCGAFLAYASRPPSSCRLVPIRDEAQEVDSSGDGEGQGGNGATRVWNEWEGTTSIDEEETSEGVEAGAGNGSMGPGSKEVDFEFVEGQLVVEVPWREGYSEQVLLLEFGRDT